MENKPDINEYLEALKRTEDEMYVELTNEEKYILENIQPGDFKLYYQLILLKHNFNPRAFTAALKKNGIKRSGADGGHMCVSESTYDKLMNEFITTLGERKYGKKRQKKE